MKNFLILGLMVLWIGCPSNLFGVETVKIAAIFGKTGPAAKSNLFHLQGVRFAVQTLNQRRGLLGKPVELVEFDNQSSALGSRFVTKKAIQSGVIAVIGASWSEHSLAMAPVLQEARIPMISPISTDPELTRIGNYIFRVCFTDELQGKILSRFARQDLHAKTAVILTKVTRQQSRNISQLFQEQFEKTGGTILWEGDFEDSMTDFAPLLNKVRSLNPDLVFFPSGKAGFAITQARKMGIITLFLGSDGWSDRAYDYGGSVIKGNYFTTHWHRDAPTPVSQAFVKAYEAQHHKIEVSGIPLAYDAVMVLADAVHRAGTLIPAQIRDALAQTRDYQGVTGLITLDEAGDPIKPVVILQYGPQTSQFIKMIDPAL
ncbi:MAG: ABC transporter substrate-binding protein [SAR324 cluster bacterium]|nr:ABC transporter substrate-binding protein [SAR324 cluster bacterium]